MRKFTLLIALMIAASVCLQSYGFTDSTFGGYFGSPISNIDLTCITPRQACDNSGIKFKYFIRYIAFNSSDLNLSGSVMTSLKMFIDSVKAVNGTPIIICNPVAVDNTTSMLGQISNGSLDNVMSSFAAMLAQYNIEIIISFGPEMNGPWCAWGQQAAAYVPAFQRAATALRLGYPKIKMAWIANWAKGYPWNASGLNIGGAYADYFPGDAYVDYVGMNIYYKDWEECDSVPAWFWQTSLDYLDFYAIYTPKHPMLITETSGVDFSKISVGSTRVPLTDAEQKIFKTEYLKAIQIMVTQHPRLTGVCFFDIVKNEGASDSAHNWGNINIDFRIPFDVLYAMLHPSYVDFVAERVVAAYPNPCTDYLIIKGLPDDVQQIQLIDLFGRVVWTGQAVTQSYMIDVSTLSGGAYVCRAVTPTNVYIAKILHN